MAIEPIGNVPEAPKIIRHEDNPLPKKKREKEKGEDGTDGKKKQKGVDITV